MDITNKELLMESARKMKAKAYVPYSKFPVGVALLLKDGAVINGVNVENVSLGATNCAERTAIFTAISNGYQKGDFQAIAVAGDTVDFLLRNTELFVYNLDNEGLLQIEDYNTVKGSSVKKPDLKKVSKRLRGYIKILLQYKEHLSKLESEIDALAKEIEEYSIIKSIPGICEKIAATIFSEIGEIDRFNNR